MCTNLGGGGRSGVVSGNKNTLSKVEITGGTEKQINFAKDILKKTEERINQYATELTEEYTKSAKRIFGSEENMRSAFAESKSLVGEYYAEFAKSYLGGKAPSIISRQDSFWFRKPSNLKEEMRSIAFNIADKETNNENSDYQYFKRGIKKYRSGEWKKK